MTNETQQAPAQDPEASEILAARHENGNLPSKSRVQKRIARLVRERTERDDRIVELEKQVQELTQGLKFADQLIGKYKLALKRRKHG